MNDKEQLVDAYLEPITWWMGTLIAKGDSHSVDMAHAVCSYVQGLRANLIRVIRDDVKFDEFDLSSREKQ